VSFIQGGLSKGRPGGQHYIKVHHQRVIYLINPKNREKRGMPTPWVSSAYYRVV